MKKILAAWWIALLSAGFCFALDPVEGYWLSVDEKTGQVTAGWEIYAENNRLFGKVISSALPPAPNKCRETYRGFPVPGRVSEMPMMGTPWIFGLSAARPGEWKDGHIIDPTTGHMYKCKIIFHGADGGRYKVDTLEMRGEIGLGIGRSQYWQKASRETAVSLHP